MNSQKRIGKSKRRRWAVRRRIGLLLAWIGVPFAAGGNLSAFAQMPAGGDFFQAPSAGPSMLPSRSRAGFNPAGFQQLPSFGSVNPPQNILPPAAAPGQIGGTVLFPNAAGGVSPPIQYSQPPAQILPPNLSPTPSLVAPPFDPFNGGSNVYPFSNPPATLNPPNFGAPVYPDGALFPNSASGQPWSLSPGPSASGWPNSPQGWPANAWSNWRNNSLPKLMEHLRFRQSWLEGDADPADVDILDTELLTTVTLPNFLGAVMPLRLSPGFTFHFWDGPDTAITGFDLPSRAFSAYLASDFISDTRRQLGIETSVTVGVYTDFKNVSSDSLRVTGVGLGWVRVNPYTTMKLGIEYFDRVDIKLLPAFGFFMQPNNDLKLDLYFPRPKVTHRLPRFGNYDVWAYAGGEYGGGSWTIERMGGFDDQVDINDVRAFLGFEWTGPRGVTGFFEGGYVFNREMLYRSAPAIELDNPDTFMLRTGIAF